MLDYASATRLYEGRKDKHTGRRVRDCIYMKYDPVRDCFVVSALWSKYECIPDPNRPGQTKYQKAPKERWDLRPFAEIHRDHVVIHRLHGNSSLRALFDVESFAARSVKQAGRLWVYSGAGRLQELHAELPIMIKNGVISSLTPPKVRTTDPKKRNEMNRLIQRVRNLIKVRTKLGAFEQLSPAHIEAHMSQTRGMYKWQMLRSPDKLVELLTAVDPQDLKSFYPVLWLSDKSWHNSRTTSYGPVDWVARYNNFIEMVREKLRRELEVIEYVEADEQSADSPDGHVEADRADKLREVQVPVPA